MNGEEQFQCSESALDVAIEYRELETVLSLVGFTRGGYQVVSDGMMRGPVIASILLIPEATALSDIILKCQISAVFFTCVPPHSSMDSPNRMVRTISPYFSPNKAIAPDAIASATGIERFSSRLIFSLIRWFTNASTVLISSGFTLAKWEKSKRKFAPFTIDPFCSK